MTVFAATQTKTMDEMCLDHARVAARHVRMKGLDSRKAGAAFIAEGLALIYGIDADSAGLLAKVCGGHSISNLCQRAGK